jgi:hypothetical protein
MKPFLTFIVILILLHSQLMGNLVKLELEESVQYNMRETLIQKQSVIDPFMLPENVTVYQNLLCKNDWIPLSFNRKLYAEKTKSLPDIKLFEFYSGKFPVYEVTPIFILNGSIRV